MRQLLAESLVLALGAGASGLLLAVWTTRVLERVQPSVQSTFPIELDLPLDGRVLAFAMILSLITTVICGLLPAWRGAQASGVAGFRGEIGGAAGRRRPFGLIAQVARYSQALDRLRALPGVLSASQTSALPLMPSGSVCASLPGGQAMRASIGEIDPGYFARWALA